MEPSNQQESKKEDRYKTWPKEVSLCRRYLPQFLVNAVKNILLFNLGMTFLLPAVIIADLTDDKSKHETLHFTKSQSTWFASLFFLVIPACTLVAGFLTEKIGRKYSIMVSCIPALIGWIILIVANRIWMIFVGDVLLGCAIGFVQTPTFGYISEISEKSIRGILISITSITVSFGIFFPALVSILFDTWRKVPIVGCCGIIVFIIIFVFIPESPLWLISKERYDEALKSLQWLRGWVHADAVTEEFEQMKRYSNNSKKCDVCLRANVECTHPAATLKEKIIALKEKKYYRPFIILIGFVFLSTCNGLIAMRSFYVQILKAYFVAKAKRAFSIVGSGSIVANLLSIFTIKFLGKRRLFFIASIGAIICCLYLAIFGVICFPANHISAPGEERFPKFKNCKNIATIVMFYLFYMLTSYGVTVMFFYLLAEVIPIKFKGFMTAIQLISYYLVDFCVAKSYIYIEEFLTLNGTMWLFAAINIAGLIFGYFCLIETEGRSLEEIENHIINTPFTKTNVAKME